MSTRSELTFENCTERWGAGVETHFQEISWDLRPVVNGTQRRGVGFIKWYSTPSPNLSLYIFLGFDPSPPPLIVPLQVSPRGHGIQSNNMSIQILTSPLAPRVTTCVDRIWREEFLYRGKFSEICTHLISRCEDRDFWNLWKFLKSRLCELTVELTFGFFFWLPGTTSSTLPPAGKILKSRVYSSLMWSLSS